MTLAEPVAIVSHDAGGAQIVSSYVKRNQLDCVFCLGGPALQIFREKLGAINTSPLDDCLLRAKSLLSSIGWSELEWQAIQKARAKAIPVTVFLDHWTQFAARFERNGEKLLPDEIWVGDAFAENLARQCFAQLPLKLVPNPYHADLRDELASMSRETESRQAGLRILYLCEPTAAITDKLKSSGYTDQQALKYFFECIGELSQAVATICLRPHPSEPEDKYCWALAQAGAPVTIGGKRSLLQEILDSDWVVGRNSMALVAGCIAQKQVFSCIPPGGSPCILPFDEIQPLALRQ